MIRYLEGKLMARSSKGVVLLVNGVGYEVEVPDSTRRALSSQPEGSPIELHISFQQSQNQPSPRLYGFKRVLERDFFEELIRVSDVGPSKALNAISVVPVPHIARAIADRDVKALRAMKGIGETTAKKMIAELEGRAAKYALLPEDASPISEESLDFKVEVRETLVKQLGFKPIEAQKAIDDAVNRNASIASAEDLFDEVLKAHK